MNGLAKKKLNLLVHIAKIDGHFHNLEKEMIATLTAGMNIDKSALQSLLDENTTVSDVEAFQNREEILYLCLMMIQADQVITDEELAFCKDIATKLGFPKYTVDRFAHIPLPSFTGFLKQLETWTTACAEKASR